MNSTVTFRELRFVITDELTQCYVLCEAGGDSPIGVQGWHHKTFPASMSVDKILLTIADCVLWPLNAPDPHQPTKGS